MIDLHLHTIYSDGSNTVKELLKMCEDKKLEYISITDHDSLKQYEDEDLVNNNIFSGKIIKGTELKTFIDNKKFEILAYNIKDFSIINNFLKKYYTEEKFKESQDYYYKKFLEICDKKGLIYDENKIEKPTNVRQYVTPFIFNELLRHEENYKKLGNLTTSLSVMYREALANSDSDYYIDDTKFLPKYEEVIDIIDKSGGFAFLAHPFEYKFEDTLGFIDEIRSKRELDGIECFHPSSADDNKKDILLEYAKKNKKYISGGTDFHGTLKPDIKVAVGRGNMNISKEYIMDWIEK